MEANFVAWPISPNWQEARITIGNDIRQACGTDSPGGICVVSPRCDGSGVVIAFRETSNPAPVIVLGDGWQEKGLVEKIMRGVLLVLEDPRRVERELLAGGSTGRDDSQS